MSQVNTRTWVRGAALSAALCALVAACGGAGGAAANGGGGDAGDPFAARRICDAECRRSARCGHPDPSCPQRCATLPVRNPPIYTASFANGMAACADVPDCGHDQDERCMMDLLVRAPQTPSSSACLEAAGASARAYRTCGVYKGLTPATDAAALACLRAQRAPERCEPPYDWK